ncbi:hypothetical protein [Pelomonas sp. KK5]|uniref:hypothetical protein n=1 Tax=Pelomonas sp. KK5 TaxID=1855730 RepID=UPI00097C09AA|nr:hypothetical protein [Pelomonas sp. KK5]
MADELDQQLMWCNRARMILQVTSGSKQKAVVKFDTELANVQVKLEKLIEMAGANTPVVKGFVDKLGSIAVLASGLRDASDPKYAGKKGQEALRKEAKEITAKLESLGKEIDKSKPAKEILEARTRLFTNCANARKRLKELGSQEKSSSTEVQELLAFIENAEQNVRTEEAYQQPAECDKATRVIAEWLGRLTLKLENQAKGGRQLDEAQARAKPLVEDRAGTAQRVLAEGLTTGQMTPEMKTKLETTLQQIELKGAGGLWTEALALCKTLPSAAECKKAWLMTKKELSSNFGPELRDCEKALNTLAPLLEPSVLEQEHTKLNQLYTRGGAKLSVQQTTQLRLEMKNLIEGWNGRAIALAKDRLGLGDRIRQLTDRVNTNAPLVSLPQKAENARQLELVTSLHDQQLFAGGVKAADTLDKQLDGQKELVAQGGEWAKLASGLQPLVQQLNVRAGQQGMPPQLQEHSRRLSVALGKAGVERLSLVRDWAALLAAHGEATKFLSGAEQSVQQFAAFNSKRQPLDDQAAKEWAKVEKAFTDFEKVAAKAKIDAAALLAPLRQALRTLKGGWAEWLANATAEDPARLKQASDGAAALVEKVLALNKPETLTNEGKRQQEVQAGQRFAAAREKFQTTELAALQLVDAVKAQALRQRLAELADKTESDDPVVAWDKRSEALAGLVKEATTATRESGDRLANMNRTLVESVQAQEEKLKTLRQAMKTKGLDLKKFAPLLDGLDTEVANLKVLTTTGNFSAAQVNNKLLGKLIERIDQVAMLVEHGSTFEDYTRTLQRSQETLDQLVEDGLGNVAPQTLAALKEQLATLKTGLYGMEPGPAAEAQRGIALALDTAGKELAAIRLQQDKAVVAANDCLRRVAAFAKLGVAETYRKSLESRIAAARNRAATASELAMALTDFEGIQAELAELEKNPDAAYARQKNVLAEQHATLKLKREWESRLSVVNTSVMGRLDKALKSGGDSSQKDEVKRMVAMAEKAVKDGKDYERGLRLLTQVEGRVAQVERNPEGTALGDRKALPKHVEGYAANVVKLRQAMETFVAQSLAQVASPERKTEVETALRKKVEPLANQLNPGLFTGPMAVLAGEGKPAGERRAAREDALARLRGASTFLTTHPVMLDLARNPVAPLEADMRALDASLTRLEAHLRAAVR